MKIPEDAFLHWDGESAGNLPEEQLRMRQNFTAAMNFAGHIVE